MQVQKRIRPIRNKQVSFPEEKTRHINIKIIIWTNWTVFKFNLSEKVIKTFKICSRTKHPAEKGTPILTNVPILYSQKA